MSDRYISVKWASCNVPYIEFDQSGDRVYPSKRELLQMLKEIQEFVEYYKDRFKDPYLDFNNE